MAEESRDYHHYVFREGKLVGEFETMYQRSEGVPWHQDQQGDWVDVRLTVELLRDLGPFDCICDAGCGLGYYLDIMIDRLGAPDCVGVGFDVSATACQRAEQIFPTFKFQPLDLTEPASAINMPDVLPAERQHRLFIIRGTLWYVYPKLAAVVTRLRSLMGEGDYLLVVQNFPPLDSSFIGKDVIPNHGALMQHFSSSFTCRRFFWYEDSSRTTNDNWFVGLFIPKER